MVTADVTDHDECIDRDWCDRVYSGGAAHGGSKSAEERAAVIRRTAAGPPEPSSAVWVFHIGSCRHARLDVRHADYSLSTHHTAQQHSGTNCHSHIQTLTRPRSSTTRRQGSGQHTRAHVHSLCASNQSLTHLHLLTVHQDHPLPPSTDTHLPATVVRETLSL